ncbi:Uncharacterised protein [Mycobacteroides abscessus subsp. abscessus]|nr:Uncharacterised protein [Mycobacteroides abscessus subsp. abscessus]
MAPVCAPAHWKRSAESGEPLLPKVFSTARSCSDDGSKPAFLLACKCPGLVPK